MDFDEYLAAFVEEGERFLAGGRAVDPDIEVPTCPGWVASDLVAHLAGVYRSVLGVLAGGEWVESGQQPVPADPLGTLAAELGELTDALAVAAADLAPRAIPTFWPDPRGAAVFWARRQAHETAIHRADLDAAAGRATRFASEFAADGLDELLVGMFSLRSRGVRTDAPVTVDLIAADAPSWRVTLSAEAVRATALDDGAGPADATVRGSAGELYLWAWNRPAEVAVSGDGAAIELWRYVRVR